MQDQKPTDAPEEKHEERPAKEPPAGQETAAQEPGGAGPAAGQAEDPFRAEEAESAPEDPMAALLAEIEVLRAEAAKMKDQALRAMADAENTRRRSQREMTDAVKYASIPLLRDLVKVADNMARALAHGAPDAEGEESGAAKALREGVALTEKELLAAFGRHGVSRIDPAGEPLNPERHEAMFEVPDETAEPGTVVQVLEPGWMLHDRLIRPARVGVARKP